MTENHILLQFAHQLADASAAVICDYYRNYGDALQKDDESPVTIADRKAEEVMRELIEEHYPLHGIIGEEFGTKKGEVPFEWVLDPIDGTTSFMIGRPTFTTLIGLLYEGEPVIGVINQAVNKERWWGSKDEPAYFNEVPTQTRNTAQLADAVLLTTAPHYYQPQQFARFAEVAKRVKHTVYGGDSYAYALVASGHADMAIDAGLKPHDYLPVIPVIESAGGVITDWSGAALDAKSAGDVIISANQTLHAQGLALLQGQAPA